ncbi:MULTISPECIES: hypothetical protein [Brevibacillus]|uniref:Uncharacterized protein n=1 Tax=Brevibacillus brevis TaxID=1393 RepID=A0A2Z4MJH2_BREBE|nr:MULTISPECIES: hypothetical protein [Brevibacillus]AWX56697.1 hypothetical protein AB432_017355 [Brevibacillus brevis]NRR22809.1 hypothetical protein [Brevibacillus sp. MS2.2]
MNFQLMTIPDAKQVTTWKYPQEYSFYDIDHSPEALQELLDGPIMQFEIIMVSLRASSVSGLMHKSQKVASKIFTRPKMCWISGCC